jgi:hypothetical protein
MENIMKIETDRRRAGSRPIGRIWAVIAALLVTAPAIAARAAEKMAVLVLATSEKDADLADNVTEMIIASIAQKGGFEITGKEEFRARLGIQNDQRGQACLDDNNCLARTAVSLGVRRIVTGNVGRRGNRQYLFSLGLVNVETGKTDNRVFRLIEGSQDDLISAVQAGTEELFRPKVEPGRIQVASQPKGARVSIDNAYLGITPLISGTLLPGLHHVRVEADDSFPWSSNVEVMSGQDLGVKLTEDNLQRRRGWPTRAAVTTGSLAALSFGAGAFLGVLSGLNTTGNTRTEAKDNLVEKKGLARDANIAFIAGAVLSTATLALVISYWSDVFGRRDTNSVP